MFEFAFDPEQDTADSDAVAARPTFSGTRISARHKDHRKRVATGDFTGGAASSATRHYIVADADECTELANFLALRVPHLRTVASPGVNSLAGPRDLLLPERARRPGPLSVVTEDSGEAAASSAGRQGATGDRYEAQRRAFKSPEAVDEFLRRCGCVPARVNPCLKAGMLRGSVEVPAALHTAPGGDAAAFLDTVLLTGRCEVCSGPVPVTVRQALEQVCVPAPLQLPC